MGHRLLYGQASTRDAPGRSILFYVSILLTQFKQAVDHFLALPINKDLAKHKMTDMEWSVLSDVQVVLEV